MISRHDLDSAEHVETPTQTRDFFLGVQQCLRGKCPEGTNDPRLQARQLGLQNRPAGGDLVWLRVAIVRWAALDHIEYVDLLTGEANSRNDPGQQLPCLTHKRFPLPILVLPWRFPNEHQSGCRVSRTEHYLRASGVQSTVATVAHGGCQLCQTYGWRGECRCHLWGRRRS